MKKCLSLLFAVAMVAAITGCEDIGGGTGVEFKNRSSQRVTVSPNGQTEWSQFILDPDQDRTIDIDKDVFFLYSPSSKVTADTSKEGEVVFRNK